jgi:hypothetical protein
VARKIFFAVAGLVIVSLLVVNFAINRQKKTNVASQPEARPVQAAPLATEHSVISPDGKNTLLMKVEKTRNNSTYSFLASDLEIFRKTVDNSVAFSIPANAWSPDNKYVFLKQTAATQSAFFVLSAKLSASEQNEQTANITGLFAQKYPDLKIQDATGWGGVNLVVFNSLKNDGARGSSFWFEMPSHAILQLSTHF